MPRKNTCPSRFPFPSPSFFTPAAGFIAALDCTSGIYNGRGTNQKSPRRRRERRSITSTLLSVRLGLTPPNHPVQMFRSRTLFSIFSSLPRLLPRDASAHFQDIFSGWIRLSLYYEFMSRKTVTVVSNSRHVPWSATAEQTRILATRFSPWKMEKFRGIENFSLSVRRKREREIESSKFLFSSLQENSEISDALNEWK